MHSPTSRPYVDFQQAKSAITVPDVLEVFGLLDQFEYKGSRLHGVCPLPEHCHGKYPNRQQFQADCRHNGVWQWFCFGDCHRGGDSLELACLLAGLDHAHLRLWLAEHFGDRLQLSRPKAPNGKQTRAASPAASAERASPPPKEEAREDGSDPQRAKVKVAAETLPASDEPIKPLKFHLKLDTTVPYLRQRGVTDEIQRMYGPIGLCSRGLLSGYVAIPVYNYPMDDFPVAYLGRWPGEDYDEDDGRPRYKWPPDFPKHRIVYGLAEALETPPDQPLIVVEGPFTVYHLVENGFPNTVSIFGSSLSDEQAELLIATGRRIVLMLDGDEAGRNGAKEAAAKLMSRMWVRSLQFARDLPLPHNSLHEALGCLTVFR